MRVMGARVARQSVLRALAHHKWGSGSGSGSGSDPCVNARCAWVEFVVVCSLLCLQAPVDQKVDRASATGFPNSYPSDSNIYPVDSAIQRLNNWGQSFFSGYSGFSLSSKTNIS